VLLKLPHVSICDVAAVTHISNSALVPHQHRDHLLVYHLYCFYKYDTQKNSLKFSQYKMINTEKVRGMKFIIKLQEQ